MREFDLGRAVPRTEDLLLLRGRGRYTDDIALPRTAHLHVLRSPHAAARIRRIDVAAAQEAPGVVEILTGQDAEADKLGTLRARVTRRRPDGSPNFQPPYRVLALDRVHHVGDPVAAVVAETLAQAKDAAELVAVDYEILPAVTGTAGTLATDAPKVWDEIPDNICFIEHIGNEAKVKEAFARARHVVKDRFVINRVTASPMEGRAALGFYDTREERYTLYAALQSPHLMRNDLAGQVFKLPANRFRLISPDVGGGFGMKGSAFPEYALVLWAAKKIGRPVKWFAERSESFVADHHARDNVSEVALALDESGRFLALDVETIANIGAYIASNGLHVPVGNLGGLAGPYTTPAIHVKVTGVFSNTNATCPYRGAGRPEASYCIERIIDIAAHQLGIDRVELRRRNLIPPASMPFKTGLVFTYDSGEFGTVMDKTLELGDWKGAAGRKAEAKRRGKLYGVGVASVIEVAGGPAAAPFEEAMEIRFDATGGATVLLGTHNHGQGHETAFRQLAYHFLGLEPDQVTLIYGDTDKVFHGRGTFGSRSLSVGGAALQVAAQRVIDKGKKVAGHVLEAATADIEFADGRFTVTGTDKSIDLISVAKASFNLAKMPPDMEIGLDANAVFRPPAGTFPNGCHLCEVEIDPETGVAAIVRYAVVDDVGRVVNPLLLKGQIHGGIAQGAGQALCETMVYDRDSGQLLSGSFMDYCMPRATDFCPIEVGEHNVPSKSNPLGIKGAGEAGCVGALPAVMNAINDALAPLGIRHFEMPATPERLWRAIHAANGGGG
ncbi:MAG: xanthine dehydrogenase family protein molybdopterin-binding subunit [Alphaproteobacteria bacterium]|nr:xanthine dehydrogenase family protein molybdopterin-binding subunit [Alphaproteobacteria bacterium]